MNRLTHMPNRTMVKGKPVETDMVCKAVRLSARPTSSNTAATSPSKVHQKTLCATGASVLPPAVIVSITSEPESDEVTKNTITKMMPNKDVRDANGSGLNISNSFNSKAALLTGAAASAITYDIAVPPKAPIHKILTIVGTMMTQKTNSRTVRPRETRAINMPTNGDQEIHHANRMTSSLGRSWHLPVRTALTVG